jgi:hypothetical protein
MTINVDEIDIVVKDYNRNHLRSNVGVDSLQDFMAAELRKLQIKQDQVGKLAGRLTGLRAGQVIERFGAVHAAREPGPLEGPEGQCLIRGIVLDQENGLIADHTKHSNTRRKLA